jgi:hypothetical protein
VRLSLQVFHQALNTTTMALTFGFPVAIFTFVGFARLTNPIEAVSALSLGSVIAVLSWTIGRVVRYVVFEQNLVINAGLARGRYLPPRVKATSAISRFASSPRT